MLIETPRLLIRDLKAIDLQELTKILADPEVMQFSSTGLPLNQQQVKKLFSEYFNDAKKYGFGVCALIHKDQNTFIGYCGVEWHETEKEVISELVYCLDRKFWNQGLAFEAATAVKNYVIENLKISSLVSLIKEENARSVNLAKKLGAQKEGSTEIKNTKKIIYKYEQSRFSI